MSLDFMLEEPQIVSVFSANITHNLGSMAEAAGIYEALWHPERIHAERAESIIPLLRDGLAKLKADPAKFEAFNAPNGWGLYKHFVPFVEEVLAACEANPRAMIRVSV